MCAIKSQFYCMNLNSINGDCKEENAEVSQREFTHKLVETRFFQICSSQNDFKFCQSF